MRLILAAIALLPGIASAGYAKLQASPPWTNDDGTPISAVTYLWHSGCVRSGQYERPVQMSTEPSHTIAGLPDSGRCWFVAAVSDSRGERSRFTNEVAYDFTAQDIVPPTPSSPPTVTFSATPQPPPVTVTVTLRLESAPNPDQPRVIVTGNVPVTIRLTGGQRWDWLKVGAQLSGAGGTVVPTTPPVGANNNDGVLAEAITVTGPVDAIADTDPAILVGAEATVAGVTKTLVRSGNTWTASF